MLALSAAYILLLGIKVFRDFAATMRALDEAGDKFGAGLGRVQAEPADSVPEAWRPAVFASPEQLRHDYEAGKEARKLERRRRRVARKAERGQPQSLKDLDLT